MNKPMLFFAALLSLLLYGCENNKNAHEIHFATSAEYPPFEYLVHGEISGFDIDLGELVAKKLGKKAVFENMQFSSVLPALNSGQADAAISTITITEGRKKNIAFSIPYYFEAMAVVFNKDTPITDVSQLADKKIACQLGSTMEIWLKKHIPEKQIVVLNSNNQAIEALKAGYADAVLLDGAQGIMFSRNNKGLATANIGMSEDGYAIALAKDSPLVDDINKALSELQSNGDIAALKKKWLGDLQ